MNYIRIDLVTQGEMETLQQIGRQTFFETFSADNSEENMKKYLEEGFSLEKLTAEFEDNNTRLYFARIDRQVVGYLKLNFGAAQTELKDDTAVEIERIYVLKEFHGKQVGQALYEKAIQVAREAKAAYVWLGVWEKNERAIQFYRKNGFVEFGQHVFKLGDDEQLDLMMRLEL
ncbi:MAG: GNAT family N-acetyltransferase [Saprospiraceae bacterium]|nr:GNAT family N-acetyltransferase [Saprospiraceae bacterium]